MLNPTAWPLSSLVGITHAEKALQDELANEEGFSETCHYSPNAIPTLGCWRNRTSRRLAGANTEFGDPVERGSGPNNSNAIKFFSATYAFAGPTAANGFQPWSQLKSQHSSHQHRKLQLVQPSTESDNVLPSLLATQHHWIVLTSNALWFNPIVGL